MQRLLEGGAYFDLDFDLIIWGWCFFETRGLIEGKRYVQDIRPVIYVVLMILLLTLYKFRRLWNGAALIRGQRLFEDRGLIQEIRCLQVTQSVIDVVLVSLLLTWSKFHILF